jgi:hypothetical protein
MAQAIYLLGRFNFYLLKLQDTNFMGRKAEKPLLTPTQLFKFSKIQI